MTDNEIIKALECCIEDEDCAHCPSIKEMPYCSEDIMAGALNLIKRQQVEIERLKRKCENTQIGYNFAQDDTKRLKKDKYKLQKALNQSEDYRVMAKSEAVKEFAARLKCGVPQETGVIRCSDVDNLVKEMVGEQ